MTESEFTAHFNAMLKAIPEHQVSPRQAAYSVLEECRRFWEERKELARLQEFERSIRAAAGRLDAPVPQTSAEVPATLVPATPPRLTVVRE